MIIWWDGCGVGHDGSVGLSPEGWLPDRVSVGALTKAFPPVLVDQVIEVTDTREVRRRLLPARLVPARLVLYFVLALWLFRGRNCGYGQVMSKLVDALYHRRRGEQLLEGLPWDPEGFIEGGRPSVAAAEHLLAVAGPGQARLRSVADAVRAGGGPGRSG
jgi:hypothetical protein